MTTRPALSPVKIIVILAIILLVAFGITRNASAPTEVSDEADTMMEEGSMEGGAMSKANTAPTTTASCGERNSVCENSDDCCGNMGLECQDVRTSDGGFGKRCLPVEVQVCRSDCDNGTWGAPRACKAMVAPKDMASCESFVGDDCKASVHDDRNTRECWNT